MNLPLTSARTIDGLIIDLASPRPDDIFAAELAIRLSRCNRFAGATREPYSVAQHSWLLYRLVSLITPELDLRIAALLHDAHEAYIGDITSPLKHLIGTEIVRRIKAPFDRAIAARFGFDESTFHSPLIVNAHERLFVAEQHYLLAPIQLDTLPPEWTVDNGPRTAPGPLLGEFRVFRNAKAAERQFLRSLTSLQIARKEKK